MKSLLDRFRKPRWQHADPAVRIAALKELGADQRDLLARIAREDADPQVRRAALQRTHDPAVAAELARADADPGVREDAQELLVKEALSGREDVAGAALAALSDPRHLVAVAQKASLESIRKAAFARLEDPKALATVARHAEDATLRAAAVERIQDPAALLDLALKSDHKEVALGALARIQDPAALQAVAARGRNKAAARKAKALTASAAPAPRKADDRPRRTQICLALEAVLGSPDAEAVARRLSEMETAWDALTGAGDAALDQRFDIARKGVRARLDQLAAEKEAERRAHEQRAAAVAAREELIRQADATVGEDAPGRIDALQGEWSALPEAEGMDALASRFDKAVTEARRRAARWETDKVAHARLAELASAAESAEGAAWIDLRREWDRLTRDVRPAAAIRERFDAVVSRRKAAEAEGRAEQEKKAKDALARVDELLARGEALAAAPAITLKEGDRVSREVKAALDDPSSLPAPDRDRVVGRLRDLRAKLFPRLQELREAEEWKRWGNVTAREELLKRLLAQAEATDLDQLEREVRAIKEGWRRAGHVPRNDEAEALARRYAEALAPLEARLQGHRQTRQAEIEKSLAEKRALVERAEALLAEGVPGAKAAREVQELQARWKQAGAVPRQESQVLWERFRAATSRVFSTHKQSMAERRAEWTKNLEQKEALAARAEALSSSTDWDAAGAEIKKLQGQWKAVGAVPRAKSDEVWKRFRTACDAFFARSKRRDEIESEQHQETRLHLVKEMEALADALAPSGREDRPPAPADLGLRVQDVLDRWERSPGKPNRELRERLEAARDRLVAGHPEAFSGTELDPTVARTRREQLLGKVGEILASLPEESKVERNLAPEHLAALLRESLAANTMGAPSAAEKAWKEAMVKIEAAQAAWRKLPPLPGPEGVALGQQFDAVCEKVAKRKPR